jgi:hypothetical protein
VSAGIAQSVRATRCGDRLPVGARFTAPAQTGPGAHPTFCTMSTGSLLGVKRPERGYYHQPQSNAEVKDGVELCMDFPCGPSWRVLGWPLPLLYFRSVLLSSYVCLLYCVCIAALTLGAGLLARRPCDRTPGLRVFFVSLCLQANSEMVRKFPSCYCILKEWHPPYVYQNYSRCMIKE